MKHFAQNIQQTKKSLTDAKPFSLKSSLSFTKEDYLIEDIIDFKNENGKELALVKWKNTWEPVSSLKEEAFAMYSKLK